MKQKTIIWLRNDFRLTDNAAINEASQNGDELIFLYIHNKEQELGAATKWFLHQTLNSFKQDLHSHYNAHLLIKIGEEEEVLTDLIATYKIQKILWNRVYEPHAIKRDSKIKAKLKDQNIIVKTFNSSLLFEPSFIKNNAGEFFKVFSPFWRKCLSALEQITEPYKKPESLSIITLKESKEISLEQLDLLPTEPNWAKNWPEIYKVSEDDIHEKAQRFISDKILNYKTERDFPALDATSKLSPYLHFGIISPKLLYYKLIPYLDDSKGAIHFFSEIGWREFSYYLLYHFPKLETSNFNAKFDGFKWQNDMEKLKKWQKGQTGFPIIDAGMRQLWQTGWMHNRIRMVVASFLIKNLLIDWRYGMKWFADCLVDADLAANAASWQWVAGSGADAAPYFRIFNPITQSVKFDPEGHYIRKWVPELAHLANDKIHQPQNVKEYFPEIVDLKESRNTALENYKNLKTAK